MTAPYYTDESVTLHYGDCLDVLREMPDASVDAVVTDPPYDLTAGKKGGTGPASVNLNSPAGRARITVGFMGQSWDGTGIAFRPDVWRECLRVLKPGSHLLAFGGSRTWHRLAAAVEDAGFEVRDSIAWLYGSGFPKSLDVSKAIDKRADVNDETKRRTAAVAEVIRRHREAKGMTRSEVSQAVVGTPSGACWNWEHQQLPSVDMWPAIKATLGIEDKFDGLIEGDRAQFIAAEREVVGTRTTGIGTGRGSVAYIADSDNRDVTAPATPAAQQWQGWGTALKPAFEPIVVARKPLVGTVAGNVLAHGTGALNIDGCRVPGTVPGGGNGEGRSGGIMGRIVADARPVSVGHDNGRWPTNVVLDGHAADELDRQSGTLTSGKMQPTHTVAERAVYGQNAAGGYTTMETYGDSGGASRFFPTFRYEAKAPTDERPRVGEVAHPTVKPLDLMRWLVRLVTPPGGVVLEPFAGSGTTAEACVIEGFRCIAIEREAAYLPLIVARLSKPIQPDLFGGVA